MKAVGFFLVIFALLPLLPLQAAVNGEILEREVDANNNGYSVMRVWGTYYEMGYAHGYLLGDEIANMVQEIKGFLGILYPAVKNSISSTLFLPGDVEDEIDGIVAGVADRTGSADVDEGDLKVLNTVGDWGYVFACRSHSCWGSFVETPTRTLSSRRLDFIDPLTGSIDHVLLVRLPADRSKVRWAGLGWAAGVGPT